MRNLKNTSCCGYSEPLPLSGWHESAEVLHTACYNSDVVIRTFKNVLELRIAANPGTERDVGASVALRAPKNCFMLQIMMGYSLMVLKNISLEFVGAIVVIVLVLVF